MPMYVINSPESKAKRKLIKKYGNKIPINTENIRGYFTITGFRKYRFYNNVDIIFHGEIYVYFDGKRDWFDSSLLNLITKRGLQVSKIKVNRIIRKNLFKNVSDFVKFFDVELKHYTSITKLKWI